MSTNNNKPATRMVTNLSIAFKRATAITEDVELAKKEHRQSIKGLIDRYYDEVQKGKAEGIRTAKELIEVIKLDLLLMGEATERTDSNDPVGEVRMQRIQESLDMDDPVVQQLVQSMFSAMNGANDDMDSRPDAIPKTVIDVEHTDVNENEEGYDEQ